MLAATLAKTAASLSVILDFLNIRSWPDAELPVTLMEMGLVRQLTTQSGHASKYCMHVRLCYAADTMLDDIFSI